MKVTIAIPIIDGNVRVECMVSLLAAQIVMDKKGIVCDLITLSECPYLPIARNTLVAMFMLDKDATDLFFVDADVGFDADAMLKILERPEELVAGIYPLKRDSGGYPVQIKTEDQIPMGRDGLIEAELLPTGFMRIKRSVIEKMTAAYPDLKYKESVVEVTGANITEAYDFFNMGPSKYNKRYKTEDYAFCQRWVDIGGECWVYPDINFKHVGRKAFQGNYHEYLLRLPGGAKSNGHVDDSQRLREEVPHGAVS